MTMDCPHTLRDEPCSVTGCIGNRAIDNRNGHRLWVALTFGHRALIELADTVFAAKLKAASEQNKKKAA